MIDKSKRLVFVFIGTELHSVDKIAVLVGKELKRRKATHRVMFCDQTQIKDTKKHIENVHKMYPNEFQFVAVDVGFCDSNSKYTFTEKGLKPANGIKKQDVVIGDVGIVINIDKVYKAKSREEKLNLLKQNYQSKRINKKVKQIVGYVTMGLEPLIRHCRLMEVENCITKP